MMPMKTIVETDIFTKEVARILGEDELNNLRVFLACNPMAGDVIPGTHGIRKFRWATAGKGRRGGARVIYYNVDSAYLILLKIYLKSEHKNIPAHKLLEAKKNA